MCGILPPFLLVAAAVSHTYIRRPAADTACCIRSYCCAAVVGSSGGSSCTRGQALLVEERERGHGDEGVRDGGGHGRWVCVLSAVFG